MTCSLRVALLAVIVLPAALAQADSRSDARDRLEEGSALYRKGDYKGALQKFEEARALFASPKIYFNLGQALNRLDRKAAAVDAFERFLNEAQDAAPERRRDAEQLLAELRPRVGFIKVIAERDSEIAVDGQPAGTAPLRRTVPVEPGTHQLTARAPGAAIGHVGSVTVAAGQTIDWEAREAPAPLADGPMPLPPSLTTPVPGPQGSVVTTPPPAEPERRSWLPWAIGGAAVVVGIVVTAVLLSGERKGPSGTLGTADWR